MNTVTINGKEYPVPGRYEELSKRQRIKITSILKAAAPYEITAIRILLVLLPFKKDWSLQYLVAKSFWYKFPVLRVLAQGALDLEHLKEMFVLTDFILKPMPPDWQDRLSFGDLGVLTKQLENIDKGKDDGSITRFTDVMLCYVLDPVTSLYPRTCPLISEHCVHMFRIFTQTLPVLFKNLEWQNKGGKQPEKWGWMAIIDDLAEKPDRIPAVEAATAYNTLMHLDRLVVKARNAKKK